MSRPGRKRQGGEETREALVAAAMSVIERDGVTTTRKIAEEARLPLGTVHYWFADTNELDSAVVATLLRQVRDEVDQSDEAVDPATRLRQVYDGFMAMPQGRQLALFEVTTRAIRNAELRHLAREQYEAYRASATTGIAPWADAADERLPGGSAALATFVVALTDGLTLASLADPEGTDAAGAIELFADLLRRVPLTD